MHEPGNQNQYDATHWIDRMIIIHQHPMNVVYPKLSTIKSCRMKESIHLWVKFFPSHMWECNSYLSSDQLCSSVYWKVTIIEQASIDFGLFRVNVSIYACNHTGKWSLTVLQDKLLYPLFLSISFSYSLWCLCIHKCRPMQFLQHYYSSGARRCKSNKCPLDL